MNDKLFRMCVAVRNTPTVMRARWQRSDLGQTATEYVGILVFVAVIFAALFTVQIGGQSIAGRITGALSDAVSDILNLDDGGGDEEEEEED